MSVIRETGDIFTYAGSPDHAIGHGVNCAGVMGAGIAKQFAERFSEMERLYVLACRMQTLVPGGVLPWWDVWSKTLILNLASQNKPGADAQYDWLASSLTLGTLFAKAQHRTLVIPEIGCGIGGLGKTEVYRVIESVGFFTETDIVVVEYKP